MTTAGKLDPSVFVYYPKLGKVREHLERHIGEPMPLEVAARVAGLEKKYFSAFFRKTTWIRYRDWVACVRVQRAARMLSESDWSIIRLAYSVGFRDLRTFERAFKKHLGTTPMRFKYSVRPGSMETESS